MLPKTGKFSQSAKRCNEVPSKERPSRQFEGLLTTPILNSLHLFPLSSRGNAAKNRQILAKRKKVQRSPIEGTTFPSIRRTADYSDLKLVTPVSLVLPRQCCQKPANSRKAQKGATKSHRRNDLPVNSKDC